MSSKKRQGSEAHKNMQKTSHSLQEVPTFIINLPQSTDRKTFMEAQCDSIGISPIFIDAVNGKGLSDSEINKYCNQRKAKQLFGRELLLGEIGCALSHIHVYQKMVDKNIAYAVIFEDDAIIKKDFTDTIKLVLDINFDWDLILLGHNIGFDISNEIKSIKSYWYKKKVNNSTNIGRIVKGGLGCYGYLITQQGAKKILDYINKESIFYPIDKITSNNKIINFYGVFPTIVSINSNFNSSIDEFGNRKNDRDGEMIYKIGKLVKKTPFFNITRALWFQYLRVKPIKKYN